MELNNQNRVEVESRFLPKEKESEKETVASEVFNDYCSSTSIHGMGYLGAKDKSKAEKIWWIIVIIISVCCCCYLISRTWTKWQTSPVILSFEQEQTPIWQIPFPAVTICPLNKVNQEIYNYTEKFRKRSELQGEESKKFWDISLTCSLAQQQGEEDPNDPTSMLDCPFNFTDKQAFKYIRNVAPDLQKVFFSVVWQGKKYDYELVRKLFTEQITEEGICFTFNSLSQYDMYTKELNHEIVYINHTKRNTGFTLEKGYSSGSNVRYSYPLRTAKDGSGSGLTIPIYHIVNTTDYVCGPMISGYKVILHNPVETPRPTQHYSLVPLGKKVTFIVKPDLITTSENLRSMDSSARKCYFSGEKYLRFFKVYTQSNCRIECSVNVTQNLCGCVPFYMPRDKKTPICGYGRTDCILETEARILDFEMIEKGVNASDEVKATEPYKIFDRCNCLPSCSDLQFSSETSQTEMHVIETMLAANDYEKANEQEQRLMKVLEGGVLIQTELDIFFKESQFLALHRSELYGQTDFLANCGGLLGLFMGFSLLSLIEIFYFLTIRLWFQWKNREKTRI